MICYNCHCARSAQIWISTKNRQRALHHRTLHQWCVVPDCGSQYGATPRAQFKETHHTNWKWHWSVSGIRVRKLKFEGGKMLFFSRKINNVSFTFVPFLESYRTALETLFELADLNGDGSLNRREFEIFASRSSGDLVQDDDWNVVTGAWRFTEYQFNWVSMAKNKDEFVL